MTYFKRFLIIFICGIVQVSFAGYLLLELSGFYMGWHITEHSIMFIPGILVFIGSGILTASYYLGNKKNNNTGIRNNDRNNCTSRGFCLVVFREQ